jgi:DNA (cytosine-5)-methyltransferase 1
VYPVVDIFAGPGGLGEGFSQAGFEIFLSAEMDPTACETLRLRKFFHQFKRCKVPEEYFQFIRGDIELNVLKEKFPKKWEKATDAVANIELGTQHGNSKLNELLDRKLKGRDDFILIGGPPCQAYSLAGRSRMLGIGNKVSETDMRSDLEVKAKLASKFYKDKRHTLYLEYLNILCRYQPTMFVMENVKGMGSAKSGVGEKLGSVFENICFGLRNPFKAMNVRTKSGNIPKGYKLYSLSSDALEMLPQSEIQSHVECIIRSENYGIPQSRHRMIIVGVRENVDLIPDRLSLSKTKPTVREAIGDMPKLRSGLSKELDTFESWQNAIIHQVKEALIGHTDFDTLIKETIKIIEKQKIKLNRGGPYAPNVDVDYNCGTERLRDVINDQRVKGVIQHETRSHIRADLLRYFTVSILGKINGKSPKFNEWIGKLASLKPSHLNVYLEDKKMKSSSHSDRFKVQVWDKPSSTVVSHISKDGHYFIHPDPTQCRSLTVREAARLQTFPDNYFFCGNRTQQYHQVGNAVPVLLARQIAETLASNVN